MKLDNFMFLRREEQVKKVPALIKNVYQRGNKLFSMINYLVPFDSHRFQSAAICNNLKQTILRNVLSQTHIDKTGISIFKRETLGLFEMGFTVALIFEAPLETQIHIREG